jgi:hypothetical protein
MGHLNLVASSSFWLGLIMYSLFPGRSSQMTCLWCNSYGEEKVFKYFCCIMVMYEETKYLDVSVEG